MSNIIYKAFKTKIYPTKEQEIYFNKCFGVSRFTYNWFLDSKEKNYSMKWKDISKEFMDNRINIPWIFEVNSRVYKIAKDNLTTAYDRYHNKISKKPKFKSKKNSKQSFSTDRCKIIDNNIFRISGEYTKKWNHIKIKTSESIDFLKDKKITQLTISKKNNIYYASFDYKEKNNYQNNSNKTVGIDLGIKTFATQSDNKVAIFPKQRILKYEKKIKKLQQVLSKKQKDSNNYLRIKSKLNKYYQKITNIKQDFLHKYTTYLAKNYKTIKIEDLDISKMLKTKKLAKSIARNSFYTFRSMLDYKTGYYNSNLIVIDRFYPSSKLCSVCGNKKKSLKLNDRVYICDCCNNKMDRDLNASINILNYIL